MRTHGAALATRLPSYAGLVSLQEIFVDCLFLLLLLLYIYLYWNLTVGSIWSPVGEDGGVEGVAARPVSLLWIVIYRVSLCPSRALGRRRPCLGCRGSGSGGWWGAAPDPLGLYCLGRWIHISVTLFFKSHVCYDIVCHVSVWIFWINMFKLSWNYIRFLMN